MDMLRFMVLPHTWITSFCPSNLNRTWISKVLSVADADYGLYVWPCAPVLANYIWLNRSLVSQKNVLEIGAGTALPGIVAAKCGASVTLSDSVVLKKCLDLCLKCVELNGVPNVSVVGITWGQVTATLISQKPVDIVLASDCFYDSKDFEDVIMTMSYILHQNQMSEVWCSYQERSSERTVEHLLEKWDLCGEEIDIPDMETMESEFIGHTLHTIRLFIIRLKKKDKVMRPHE